MTSIFEAKNFNFERCLCLPILVINWGTPDETTKCLNSVRLNSPAESCRVILVDNRSPDSSGSKFASRQDLYFRFFQEKENHGFTKVVNQFIKITAPKDVILLNSDAWVEPGWIDPLYELLRSRDDIGMVFPRLVQRTNRKTKDGLPCAHCSPNHHIDGGVFFYNDWCSFASVMIKRELVESIGYLDERFFNYGSDKDYGLRATKRGWKLAHTDDSVVHHMPSTSFRKYRNIAEADEARHLMMIRRKKVMENPGQCFS